MEIILRERLIGDLEQLNFRSHWNWLGDPEKQWRFQLENMFLDDIGIHQIDTIRMLLNNRKAKEVYAINYTPKSYPLQSIKTTASGLILMDDEIQVNYFGSMGTKGENVGWFGDISLFGSEGSMHRGAYGEPYYYLEKQKKKIGMDCDDIDKIIPFFEFEKIAYILEDFYHAIIDNRPPVTDLHDNINSHAILLAMKKSATERRIIDVQTEFPIK
jgi:predicted dehydrogenase